MDGKGSACTYLSDLSNHASQHDMYHYWSKNWTKPLQKCGDVNNVNNYWSIMVGTFITKLFGV